MSKINGVKKFSRHQDVIERRMRVISRLEQQLKDDFKNTKTGAMQLLPKDDDSYYGGHYTQYYGIDNGKSVCFGCIYKPHDRFTILTVDEFIELTEHQNKTYELW